ncbi:MAG: NADPH-dependent 7-cyano-7-deazaguanine reductase QueF [Oleispira sp.]|nr:NADPH-dependent 7-cyano-7-deazaguanine reductase QueF [Oleispira sp.]
MASVHSESNPLGKQSDYIDNYDATLLFPISRAESWKAAGIERNTLPFFGEDVWNGYEISWLNDKGIPQVAMAEFRLPATSPFLIESKSFKLYLNSYNQTRFANKETVERRMVRDLSAAAGGEVKVTILALDYSFPAEPKTVCIDDLDISMDKYELDPTVLKLAEGAAQDAVVDVSLVSHLLKSNCPVTGQPDWGSLYIEYKGAHIDEKSLLTYVVSLRTHQDFHEQCVERTFWDIWTRCKPEALTVYARYVRRGGLDINPMRSSDPAKVAINFRTIRQ